MWTDPRTTAHTGREPDLHLPRSTLHAGAPTRFTRILDVMTPTTTLATRPTEREGALVLGLYATTPTRRAGHWAGSRTGTTTRASTTGGIADQVNRRGDAIDRLGECEGQPGLQVDTALTTATGTMPAAGPICRTWSYSVRRASSPTTS